MNEIPEPCAAEQELWNDLRPVLDEELARLPQKYRVLIILCDLEGLTRQAAACRLGLSPGTVAGRLARGRNLLAERLARRGVVATGGILATLLGAQCATATVPPALYAATLKSASLLLGKATASVLLLTTSTWLILAVVGGALIFCCEYPSLSRGVAPAVVAKSPALPSSEALSADAPRCWTVNTYASCRNCHATPVRPPAERKLVASDRPALLAAVRPAPLQARLASSGAWPE